MRRRPQRQSCPFCKRVSVRILLPPESFWETWVFPLLGLKPFRCPDCRRRFLGFGDGVLPEDRRRRMPPPDPPPPSGDLDQLVREIRESEQRYGLGTRRAALPEDASELSRRERTLLKAELGAPDDVVDGEILDPLPDEDA